MREVHAVVESIAREDDSTISKTIDKKDGVMAEGIILTTEPTDPQIQGEMAVDMVNLRNEDVLSARNSSMSELIANPYQNEENVNLSINNELIEEVPSGSVQVGPEEIMSGSVPSLPKPGDCKIEKRESLKRTLPGSLDQNPSSDIDMGPKLDSVSLDNRRVLDPVPKREECGSYVSKKLRRSEEVCDKKEGSGVAEMNRSQEAKKQMSLCLSMSLLRMLPGMWFHQ
ncbi:hypothetical protein QYF36_005623 [Acer negundo]|nr:hypothetical protein QYF36_005623 [Acer negundo]